MAKMTKTISELRLSVEPLLTFISEHEGLPLHRIPCAGCGNDWTVRQGCLHVGDIAVMCGVTIRSVQRWMHKGLPIHTADAVATWLGWHPTVIWGHDWDWTDEGELDG